MKVATKKAVKPKTKATTKKKEVTDRKNSSWEQVSKTATKQGKTYGCSMGKDKNGYFVYTHRARSKSYETKEQIPIKDLKFIESTG